MNQITLGRQIRKYRLLKKVTQNEVSIAADVSRNYISDLERGIKGCSLDTLIKIANYLDVSIDTLLKAELKMHHNLNHQDLCQDILRLEDHEIRILSNFVAGMIAQKIVED